MIVLPLLSNSVVLWFMPAFIWKKTTEQKIVKQWGCWITFSLAVLVCLLLDFSKAAIR